MSNPLETDTRFSCRPTIYISGVDSGPNPSPGVSVCRSLRTAFPNANLVSVDYSNRSSGLHWHQFDDIWVQRPWNELDFETYIAQIRRRLDAGGYWISGLDLETHWLAQSLGRQPRALIPNIRSLRRVSKSSSEIANSLGIRVPPTISIQASDWQLAQFCRERGWNVWLKGPHYEAHKIHDWSELNILSDSMSSLWSTRDLFIQQHVDGHEESIAFSAYRGRLLDCVYMNKLVTTTEGKTWSGRVDSVPADLRDRLVQTVDGLGWTGGGEIEMMRDRSGQLWFIECNPRFPAWIHGATICRTNLPALLIAAAAGLTAPKIKKCSADFTRVVVEIPVRSNFPLPPLTEPPTESERTSGKHPSAMPALAKRLEPFDKQPASNVRIRSQNPTSDWFSLEEMVGRSQSTPFPIYDNHNAASRFDTAARCSEAFAGAPFDVRFAYSIKTNPNPRLLNLARANGFYAEAISGAELNTAIEAGFSLDEIILNGPGKFWGSGSYSSQQLKAIFCDSISEFDRLLGEYHIRNSQPLILGLRLRPPNIVSRFGVDLTEYDEFLRLIDSVSSMPHNLSFGIHFHMASNTIGFNRWIELFESMVRWGVAINQLSTKTVELFDAGGGWHPDDWNKYLIPRLHNLLAKAHENLGEVKEFVFEPGRAIVQPSGALAMTVIEVRKSRNGSIDVVVDGSIADLPDVRYYPHRFYRLESPTKIAKEFPPGNDRILGRLCMEDDILSSGVLIPVDLQEGEILIASDAGAYDRSMSYEFGTGRLK